MVPTQIAQQTSLWQSKIVSIEPTSLILDGKSVFFHHLHSLTPKASENQIRYLPQPSSPPPRTTTAFAIEYCFNATDFPYSVQNIGVIRTPFAQTKTQSKREHMYCTHICTAMHIHVEVPWRKRLGMEGRSVLELGGELGLRLV